MKWVVLIVGYGIMIGLYYIFLRGSNVLNKEEEKKGGEDVKKLT